MRYPTPHALLLIPLWVSCFNPDLSSKPCKDNNGCFPGYFCDTSRSSTGVVGYCSEGPRTVTDMAVDAGNGLPALPEVELAGGSFTIGSASSDTYPLKMSPTHTRMVPRYFMDEREVTVAAYRACVTAGKCPKPHTQADSQGQPECDKCNYDVPNYDNHPVNCVEYEYAKAFCSFMGRRLPTETEWEFAANGLTVSTDVKYPWGNLWDPAKACFNTATTCPVAAKVKTLGGSEVNAGVPGFYDLSGNVWEWTDSEPCVYKSDGTGLTCGLPGERVVRGGSGFDTDQLLLRSTVRFGNKTGNVPKAGWNNRLGFRCARTP